MFKNKNLNLPIKNTSILCITSLWIFIPIIIGNNNYYLLKFTLFCCSIFSIMFWYNKPKHNSILHNLDRLSASFNIIYMIYISYYILNYYLIIILLSNILIFYLLSFYNYYNNYYDHQLLFHLTFRYFVYIWTYFILVDYNIKIITICYILHCYYLLKS